MNDTCNDPSIQIFTELCAVPTAPFVEHRVIAHIERFVKARRRLSLARDRFGNLLIELKGTKENLPRWVFTAHMDHPGFIARSMPDDRTLHADFHGGVLGDYFEGSKVRFLDGPREVVGVVTSFTMGAERAYPVTATIRVKEKVAGGSIGMWDLTPGRIQGGVFHGRVCDDLAGAASALSMIDQLHRKPPASPVAVLLTRAEEEGFIGAIAASIRPTLLRKSDRIIAIECSAEQPHTPQGDGVVIRVGDRTSVFNSGLTYFLTEQAQAVAKSDADFKYQRALMPGGTCEATVYDAYGFTAAAACVPLGNYHNMDRDRKKIAAEYVNLNDWHNMVRLFVRVARQGHTFEPEMKALKERLEKRFTAMKELL